MNDYHGRDTVTEPVVKGLVMKKLHSYIRT